VPVGPVSTRRRIERRLGQELPDSVWEEEGDKLHHDMRTGGTDFAADIARSYVELPPPAPALTIAPADRWLRPRRTTNLTEDEKHLIHRAAVMGRIATASAMEGSLGKWIDRWRKEHLPKGLLKPSQVAPWIERTTKRWGPGERFLFFWQRGRTLALVTVPEDSPLALLAILVEEVEASYGITIPDGVNWILTDRPPSVLPVRIVQHPLKPGQRMLTEIDPTLTSKELVMLWPTLQWSFYWSSEPPVQVMSAKALELAAFYAETRRSASTWEQRRREWNRKHPRDSYDHRNNLQRDATNAYRRLTALPRSLPPE